MYGIIRKLLFTLSPQTAHTVTLKSLRLLCRGPVAQFLAKKVVHKPRTVMGLEFANCIGLAAGLDVDGDYIDALSCMGFGFLEIGGVTPKPQPGNPKPWVFRIPEARALINRKGFGNKGVDNLVENLKKIKFKGVLGINIAKNKDTPVEEAAGDYLICLRKLYPYASFITVNISSPNTPGMRDLQFGNYIEDILSRVKKEQQKLHDENKRYVPLVLKISPDINAEQIKTIAEQCLKYEMDGVIATNTSVQRPGVEGLPNANEVGGLSGAPLFSLSLPEVKELAKHLQGKIPIIACGGIMSAEDAKKMLDAGASLVQVMTGFIYEGPKLIHDIAFL